MTEPITQEELNEKIKLHGMWLRDEEGGVRLDLSGADLSDVNLSGAILVGANLGGADLSGADLSGAKYNDNTIFFNPEREGMIKDD